MMPTIHDVSIAVHLSHASVLPPIHATTRGFASGQCGRGNKKYCECIVMQPRVKEGRRAWTVVWSGVCSTVQPMRASSSWNRAAPGREGSQSRSGESRHPTDHR